ncbi:hypothetical protein ACHAQJ_005333 [Trichoderma viride]
MANKVALDLKLLQSSAPGGQATHLRDVLISDPAAVSSITSELISHVASDVLPSIVLSLWPMAANEPHAIIATMSQELCLSAQRSAIRHFYRHLRCEKTFAKAWEAVGGATGIAQLVAKLNVDHARLLFSLLGDAGRAVGARKERQSAMEELLRLLWGNDEEESTVGDGGNPTFDSRPLRREYARLVPACGGAFRVEWEAMKRQLPEGYDHSVTTDQEFYEHYYNEKLQRGEITASDFLHNIKPLACNRIDYGLHILYKFAESEILLETSPGVFLETIVDPLGKRFTANRRMSGDITMHFWSRVIRCLKERQVFHTDFQNSSDHYRRIVARMVKVWNYTRAKAEYTEMLATLFSVVPKTVVKGYSPADLVRNVIPALRYQLLRLFLKNAAGYQFDIGEPDSLEHTGLQSASLRWPVDIFFALSANEALLLFEKVQRAGKDVGFWNGRYGSQFLYERRNEDEGEMADRHILQALLLHRNKIGPPSILADLNAMRSEIRLQEVPRRMKKAVQGRSPENRAEWVVATLSLCMALGDLDLYAETLRWTRRFNKDPLAVREIYSRHCISRKEGVDLLIVLPTKEMRSAITLEELTKGIHSADEVLQILYETAIMAINEPSFNLNDWWDTFNLINQVVVQRLSRVNDFQDRSKISGDELYNAVWQPTFTMLKKMIPNLLGSVGEKFQRMNPYAIISKLQINKPETLREPTIKFLDALAAFHDSIWTERRMRETPAIVTTDEIWPKGLTIQHLSTHFDSALAYLPYAQLRIEAIVFINAQKALAPVQVDEEAQVAIGRFVDSWLEALELYIQMPGPKELSSSAQRQEHITRAWKYATVDLSKDRMSLEEAERFWWPVFERAHVKLNEVGIDETTNQRSEPSLPDEDEDMQPIEWNPDSDYDRISQPAKDKTLIPVYLDVLISQPRDGTGAGFHTNKVLSSVFEKAKAAIPGKPRPRCFWNSLLNTSGNFTGKLTGKSVDAYATAGILALNMKYGSDISLLKTPFPDSDVVRIPAVYLDQEFLEREVDNDAASDIIDMLDKLKSYVPARLLVHLATSILKSIEEKPETERPYSIFTSIIRIILDGINPSSAFPLIQQFVLENPDASSWHRLLLNPRSLMNLLPSDAKKFFESFTDAILDKLQEQAERRAKEPDASASKRPLVKVTTVKMLAQLLRESPVVDPSLAVDLNIRILKRATHVDIRTASTKALTEAITTSTNFAVRQRILDALSEHAAPIASSIHEARPSIDWDAVTSNHELPEVWEDDSGNFINPPIMDLIMCAGSTVVLHPDQEQVLYELKYSILDSSAENNRRWTERFLEKNGFSVPDDAQFPAVPVFPTALSTLLTIMDWEIPLKYIDLIKQYILLRLSPPDWLSSINKSVQDDKDLSRSNAGKHWYNLWSSDNLRYMTNVVLTISESFSPENMLTDDDEETISYYQALDQLLFEIADALVMRGQPPQFQAFLGSTGNIDRERPVWGRLLDRINSLRTPAWQADSNRKPEVLPDTLPLKIRVLNLPHKKSTNPEEAKAAIARCTTGVVELLNEIVSSGSPYYHGFSTLQKELESIEPLAEFAILLGSVTACRSVNEVTLVDHLRLELAVAMLNKSNIFMKGLGKAHDESVVEEAGRLVMDMSNSHIENFRTLSAPLKRGMENDTGFDWWS